MGDFGHSWPNQGGLGHAEEVYCSADECGAGDVESAGSEAACLVAEGATRPRAHEGGCRWSELDRRRNRRSLRLYRQNCGIYPRTPRDRGIRDRAQRQTQKSGSREGSRWGARSQDHRVAVGPAAERIRQLDAAAPGRTSRGAGNRGVGQPRDPASDAKKNKMTKRKIEYWVIPPEAD